MKVTGLRPAHVTVAAWAVSCVEKQWKQRPGSYPRWQPQTQLLCQHLLTMTPGITLMVALWVTSVSTGMTAQLLYIDFSLIPLYSF